MKLISNDFKDNDYIPSTFTCDGKNISPQLYWENIPDGAKSYALSVTDPDAIGAPRGTEAKFRAIQDEIDRREKNWGSV